MTEPPKTPCALYQLCQHDQAERWDRQEKRNLANDEMFKRWGARMDHMDIVVSECQATLAGHLDYAAQMRKVLTTMQGEMASTTLVLGELAASIKDSREAAERNHADLLSAVAANASVAARAVDRADLAATRADDASRASGESAGRISKLTTATLAGWSAAVLSMGALLTHLVVDYGLPWLKALFNKL